jgi:hypothetical protein
MTTDTLDAPLLENTDDALGRPLQAALQTARDDVLAAATDLLAIPEGSLTRPWTWIGGSDEAVRYGAWCGGSPVGRVRRAGGSRRVGALGGSPQGWPARLRASTATSRPISS